LNDKLLKEASKLNVAEKELSVAEESEQKYKEKLEKIHQDMN
jgi:hypothetical protein